MSYRERPLLSIIFPAYNEIATIRDTLNDVLAHDVPGLDKEIIVVESNSSDGTREAVLEYSGHERITILLEEKALGKGHAVRAGLARAAGDFILIQDADREYDVSDYDALLGPLMRGEAAFVLGSRHTGTTKIRHFADEALLAAFMNFGHHFFQTLLNVLYGQRLKDPFTMYKVFRRDCLDGVKLERNRFDFDIELVVKLIRKGYQPIEIPVNYSSRMFSEGKKTNVLRDPWTWLGALIQYRFSRLEKK
jgi:glycosyltransferase involved in cell wall biosynthesis